MAEIDSLPDEILQTVFSLFSLPQRLKLEQVCKRWAHLMPYRIKELDFVQILIPPNRLKHADTFPSTPVVGALLKRCGPTLQRLSFGKSNLLIPFTVINKVEELCPHLEHLDLSFCTVTEQIVPAMMNLAERLRSIDFGNTSFSIRSPPQHVDNMSILFANMHQLEHINLQRTSAHNLMAVPHLPDTLRSLNLNGCSPLLASDLFELVVKCYDLEELRLSAYSHMNFPIIEAICTLSRLRILDISRQSEYLTMADNYEAGDWRKLGQVTTLKELYAQYNDNMTNDVLDSIARHCHLRVLNVSYCRAISTFSPWIGRLNCLTAFYVAAHDALTDTDVRILAEQNAQSLRVFHAPACPQITGQSLIALATFCHHLVDLNLGQCDAIKNEEVEQLFNSCTQLETVDLRSAQITDALFENVQLFSDSSKVMRRLERLDISYCSRVTDVGIKALCDFLVASGIRKEPVTVFVHQTRVTRAVIEGIDCNCARMQF